MRRYPTTGDWTPPGFPPVPARWPTSVRSHEARTRRIRGLIAAVAFLAMVGGGWLAETQGVLMRLREGALTAFRTKAPAKPVETDTKGRIVYESLDGLECTYIPFDNIAEWMGEPTTTMCESAARKQRKTKPTDFSWGQGAQ